MNEIIFALCLQLAIQEQNADLCSTCEEVMQQELYEMPLFEVVEDNK